MKCKKNAAAESNTMRVRRHIHGVYQSLQSVTEDRQSLGCGRIYPDYTAPTITATIKANPLSAVFLSVAVVLAAACDSVVTTTRACCHRLPIYVRDHHRAAYLLFCSGSAAWCLVYQTLLPIPF